MVSSAGTSVRLAGGLLTLTVAVAVKPLPSRATALTVAAPVFRPVTVALRSSVGVTEMTWSPLAISHLTFLKDAWPLLFTIALSVPVCPTAIVCVVGLTLNPFIYTPVMRSTAESLKA